MKKRRFILMTSAILALALLTIVLQSEAVEPAPEIFAPGIISAEHHEFSCSFSPDGTEVYFNRRVPELNRNRIMVSRRVDGKWTQPVLAEKAGDHEGIEPFITPDGKFFYFQSWRPFREGIQPSLDIWMMKRNRRAWGEPVRLETPFNPMKAMYLSMTGEGKIYTTDISDKKGKTRIVMVVKQGNGYSGFSPLPDIINTTGTEFYPCISLKEDFLLFTRTGDRGKSAIFLARKGKKGKWTLPRKVELGMENVTMPRLSPDEKWFYFTHVPYRLMGDIYRVGSSILKIYIQSN